MTTPNQTQDKLDKRAAALRDNLRKRKAAAKSKKTENKDDKKKD